MVSALILVALLIAAAVIASNPKPSAPITVGDSKANCIDIPFTGGVLSQAEISAASSITGVQYNCLTVFNSSMPAWSNWESPWMFSKASDNWDSWLRANSAHQVVMGMDLIPKSVANGNDPLTWERPCAAGNYSHYATTLAGNLISEGAGSIVIRLGVEANGTWETDYTGTTIAEMKDWAECYDAEVTAMRAVPGAHFLFVWNPGACSGYVPIDKWYPGNSYVDIIGIDTYDEDCQTLKTVAQEGWTAFSTDSASRGSADPEFPSLANIVAFAESNDKPLSFPEWGLGTGDDDATYVKDIGSIFKSGDFSFESYFDNSDDGIAPLGPAIPSATAAYSREFKLPAPRAGIASMLSDPAHCLECLACYRLPAD